MKRGLVVLHQGAIGDFVLTLSVVQAVRASGRFEHVLAIASAPSAKASASRSAVDEWVSPDSLGLHTLYLQDGPVGERLRSILERAGMVLSFLGDEQSGPHRRLKDCNKVISIDPRPTADTERQGRHITQQWAEAIRLAGLDIGEPTPARIEMDMRSGQKPMRVIIHPGSGGRSKCWPLENFIRVAEALSDCRVFWMLGPAELESGQFDLSGREIICEPELFAAMQKMADADLFIGNDAGMTHVAAAMGLPTVAIFGPTDPRIWRPLGSNVRVVAPHEDQVIAAANALLRND